MGPERSAGRISFSGYPLRGFIYALGFLLPVSGSINPFMLIGSDILSSSNWFCMYALIAFLLRPAVSAKYPLAQKCLFPYLYFRFACRSNIIRLLFPFRYPIVWDTLYFEDAYQHMDVLFLYSKTFSCLLFPSP